MPYKPKIRLPSSATCTTKKLARIAATHSELETSIDRDCACESQVFIIFGGRNFSVDETVNNTKWEEVGLRRVEGWHAKRVKSISGAVWVHVAYLGLKFQTFLSRPFASRCKSSRGGRTCRGD